MVWKLVEAICAAGLRLERHPYGWMFVAGCLVAAFLLAVELVGLRSFTAGEILLPGFVVWTLGGTMAYGLTRIDYMPPGDGTGTTDGAGQVMIGVMDSGGGGD